MRNHFRHVPLIRNVRIRAAIGFALLVVAVLSAQLICGKGRIEMMIPIAVFAWVFSIFLTDKYVHKYPQRYATYLVASHLKAATIMAVLLWIMGRIVGSVAVPQDGLWSGFIYFVILDVFFSALRRRDFSVTQPPMVIEPHLTENGANDLSDDSMHKMTNLPSVDAPPLLEQVRFDLGKPLVEFMGKHLSNLRGNITNVHVLAEDANVDDLPAWDTVCLLVSCIRLNDVRRLNRFFLFFVRRISMEGYLVCRYMPLENETNNLKRRYTGMLYRPAFLLHFFWHRAFPKIPWLNGIYFFVTKGRNRVLSKVEIWGRLSYCGMKVIAESEIDGEKYLIAQRVGTPVQNRKPTYYPVVSLEKVGLDGEIFRTHKIRTMFPFSEFLQKQIFEDNGLGATGKFMNDYRLTEYGNFLRKYWLDELPGIFDWLRGNIKLVGNRATSRHYLSLYPKNFYDLYIQIKPGLVPPIFDENITDFEQIVHVELSYLQNYWDRPFRTDLRCLMQTFTDIVFRGIRSR